MTRSLASVIALVALVSCRSDERAGASNAKRQDALQSPSAVEAFGSHEHTVTPAHVAESTSENLFEGAFQPPEPVYRPAPDWKQFPTGHIPGPGGVYSARVDVSGNVVGVAVVRPGHPKVDELVLEALRIWRFKPAMRDGRPIEATYNLTININLK